MEILEENTLADKDGGDGYNEGKLSSNTSDLFNNHMFYLSREVPRYSLEFVIKACGGQVGWDISSGAGSTFKEDDERITHQICDRSSVKRTYGNREYLQPQWIYDCINRGSLLRLDGYRIGDKLPPHLSPFVESTEGDYIPDMEQDIEEISEKEKSKPLLSELVRLVFLLFFFCSLKK